jgi:threonylcarbamoyladenosine tRNA methylthiotransferase MtaB
VSTFFVENFGCRATQADGAAMEREFLDLGLERAPDAGNAQFVVLNTCAVTESAEQDARAAIRRVRRDNPGCQVIVTGCYAQRAPLEVAALPGVSKVIGNSHKHHLAQITLSSQSEMNISQPEWFVPVEKIKTTAPSFAPFERSGRPFFGSNPTGQFPAESIFVSDIFAHTELLAAPVFDSSNQRTRPNLKIQDGCNNRCSFCIIPSVRGRSRSLKIEEVLRQVNQLVEAGYREVVISGINLGRWGRDLPITIVEDGRPHPSTLEQLVWVILDQTSLQKLRISSVEPMDWSDSLIRLMAKSPRIARHAHVPMQSGSDTVLRRMRRKYRPWHYRQKIEKIRDAMPAAAIGADVMVGFPGETDTEFEETRRMVEDLPFTYLHVFTFSARPGTPAATMPGQVPVHIARERNRILRDLASEKKLAFMRSFVGQNVDAITLNVTSKKRNGTWTEALTDNYLKLELAGRYEPNRWLSASVDSVQDSHLLATAIV